MRLRLLGLALLYLAITGATVRAPTVHIMVVVNAANPTTTLQRERLSRIFLRQVATWDNGQEILPVDQIDRSPVYIAFVRDIQRRSVASLKRYWEERIFSGNESPPPERVTDADVLTYVRSNAGAIGYIVEGSDLGTGVKVLVITDM